MIYVFRSSRTSRIQIDQKNKSLRFIRSIANDEIIMNLSSARQIASASFTFHLCRYHPISPQLLKSSIIAVIAPAGIRAPLYRSRKDVEMGKNAKSRLFSSPKGTARLALWVFLFARAVQCRSRQPVSRLPYLSPVPCLPALSSHDPLLPAVQILITRATSTRASIPQQLILAENGLFGIRARLQWFFVINAFPMAEIRAFPGGNSDACSAWFCLRFADANDFTAILIAGNFANLWGGKFHVVDRFFAALSRFGGITFFNEGLRSEKGCNFSQLVQFVWVMDDCGFCRGWIQF